MLLKPENLDAHLAKTLAPLYVISSNEHLLLMEAADKIREAARKKGCTERDILTVERSFKWSELGFANNTLSLFGDKKIIELRIPTGRVGTEGAKVLGRYADDLNPDNVTLITLPGLNAEAKKSVWITRLRENAVFIEIPVVERQQLGRWIKERLALQNQHADPQSIAFLASRVEGNLLAAHQEIRKLGLLYPEGRLEFEQLKDAVLNVARYDVFKLKEAMLAGDTAHFSRMMEGLKGEGESLIFVLWAIADEIRTLLQLHNAQAQGKPLGPEMGRMRIWGNRQKLIPPALKRISADRLRRALQDAALADRTIKGLQVKTLIGDAWDALLQLGLGVTQSIASGRQF